MSQNTLTVRVSGDAWQGDPQFTVTVDGKQVGGPFTTSASHASRSWQNVAVTGNFAADPSSVGINFLNDGYGGWGLDRNLYVQSMTVGGKTFSAASATDTGGSTSSGEAQLLTNGTVTFDTSSLSASSGATTATDRGLPLLGVNLAGAEFGSNHTPGTYGTDYTYPTNQEIDYYAAKGLDVIRVPFLWERMQTTLNGPLNTAELARLSSVVNYATSKGLKVILDPHDYGTYKGSTIGSSAVPNSSFADFWGKLSGSFKSNPNVIYGLMNEPNQQSPTQWTGSVNAAIAAIRTTGAGQEILVPGTSWDGAWTWNSSGNAATVGTGVKDPRNNYAFEVHQYLDPNGSGTSAGVSSDTIGVDRLTAITNWAEANKAKLFLGEFGVSQDKQSLSALDKMLTYMGQHADVWQGGTYWAGGPWWWGSNIYGIEPNGLGTAQVTDQPQMAILQAHESATGSTSSSIGPSASPLTPDPASTATPVAPTASTGPVATTPTDPSSTTLSYSGYGNVVTFGDSAYTIDAGAGSARVTLGNGQDKVVLAGYTNSVTLGNGNDTVTGGAGSTTVELGNGNDTVIASGYGNQITVGSGTNTVVAGSGSDEVMAGPGVSTITLAGYGNTVTTKGGTATISGAQGSDTYLIEAGHAAIATNGWNDHVQLIQGASADIDDAGHGLKLDINSPTGTTTITGFGSDTSGVVDLIGGQHFSTTGDVINALQADGHGGTTLALDRGSVDFVGVTPNALHATNFHIS